MVGKDSRTPQVVVVGLDGATWDVILPAFKAGRLPTIRRIVETGAWCRLRSTTPPITTPAWSSFATGRSPGGHGVYAWDVLQPNSYVNSVTTRAHLKSEAVWQVLDRFNRAAGVYAVPVTYPPVELRNGYVVSSFGAPRLRNDMAAPSGLVQELKEAVGARSLLSTLEMPRGDCLDIDDARTQTEINTQAALHLIEHHPVDAFITVYMITDQVSHLFYGSRGGHTPDGTPVSDFVTLAYDIADQALGRLLEGLHDDVTVILLSDHGFGPATWEVDVNHLLEAAGLLKRRVSGAGLWPRAKRTALAAARTARHRLVPFRVWDMVRRRGGALDVVRAMWSSAEIDWANTVAYSWSMGGVIRLNVKGREPRGTVEPGAVEAVREEVIAALKAVEVPEVGGCPVAEVVRSEEAYGTSVVGEAPDLIAIPNYELGCDFGPPSLGHGGEGVRRMSGASPPRSGSHRPFGILAAAGPLVRHAQEMPDADITDLAPTILYMLDVPIPTSMTGTVIEELVAEDVTSGRQPQYCDDTQESQAPPPRGMTEEEEEAVKARLRDLGYFE